MERSEVLERAPPRVLAAIPPPASVLAPFEQTHLTLPHTHKLAAFASCAARCVPFEPLVDPFRPEPDCLPAADSDMSQLAPLARGINRVQANCCMRGGILD